MSGENTDLEDVTGSPETPSAWVDLIESLDSQIQTLQEKCENGRVYDVEKEEVRIKWQRRLIKALAEKRKVLKEAPLPKEKTPKRSKKRLYIIEGDGIHKIGVSRLPDQRLRNLQLGSPVNLELVYKSRPVSGAELIERNVHEDHSEYNSHGEWFDFPDGILGDVVNQIETAVSGKKNGN